MIWMKNMGFKSYGFNALIVMEESISPHENKIAVEIRKWMESPESKKILEQIAHSFLRFSKIHCLPSKHSGLPDVLEDISADLVEFILTSEKIAAAILYPEDRNPVPYIRRSFINFRIDQNRKPGIDFRRYLHKRILKVIRESDQFHVVYRNKAAAFGKYARDNSVCLIEEDDWAEIPYPFHLCPHINYESISDAHIMLQLAGYFREQIATMWMDETIAVPVHDFISWLLCHIPVPGYTKQQNIGDMETCLPYHGDHRFFDADLIQTWAGVFAERLGHLQKQVFFLHHCREATLSETARLLGAKSPSTATNHRDRVQNELKAFLRDLPWLSAEDLHPKAFSLFFEILCTNLEKSVSAP